LVLAPFEDRLACFTADSGNVGHPGVFKSGPVGPAGLTRAFAVEEGVGDVFFCDAAGETVEPDETTEFERETAELRKRVASAHAELTVRPVEIEGIDDVKDER
jgi:hypothetical protein